MATHSNQIEGRSQAVAIGALVTLPILGFLIAFFGSDTMVYVGVAIMALSVVVAIVGVPRLNSMADQTLANSSPGQVNSVEAHTRTVEQTLMPWELDVRALDVRDESEYQAAIMHARALFAEGNSSGAIRTIELAARRYHGDGISEQEMASAILAEIETQSRAADLQSSPRQRA